MKRFLTTVLLLSPALAIAQSPAPTVGKVSFPDSGAPAAQSDFFQGLAQLHNFEYEASAKHFRRDEELAPNFAMA